MNIKKILSSLTLDEKCSLLSGMDNWCTQEITRLAIPKTRMADGPAGIRKEVGEGDLFGNSYPATAFPLSVTQASTWNLPLMYKLGQAIALEAIDQDVDTVLGPGVNIKRSPLCGRNFEYFSEDPYLSGKMGSAFIQGVQSKGVGTSIKHYAVNNQETLRMSISAKVDFKTLHEIYLKPFEIAIKEAHPVTVMAAYNKVNQVYATEHPYLLNEVLLKSWGYEGLIISDWTAIRNRVKALKAGLHLQMPGDFGLSNEIVKQAILNKELDEKILDEKVETILRYIHKIIENRKVRTPQPYDYKDGHQVAKEVGLEGAVLLKNDQDILPLNKTGNYVIIGKLAKDNNIAGTGSSIVNPKDKVSLFSELDKQKVNYTYLEGSKKEYSLIKEIVKDKDAVLVFLGLSGEEESEGFDRIHLKMKEEYQELIKVIKEVNEKIILVLSIGSPVEIPYAEDCQAILNMYLQGEVFGEVAYQLLFGLSSPSGHLAETFPLKLEDTLSSKYFPMGPFEVIYEEKDLVGYRYFDRDNKPVLFPFGHGLTYAKVEYSSLAIQVNEEEINISLKVKNIGKYKVKEVIQVYIKGIDKAYKELKAFNKVDLDIKEEKEVNFKIDKPSLKVIDEVNLQEVILKGKYLIYIGASILDIRLKGEFNINNEVRLNKLPPFIEVDKTLIKDNKFKYNKKNFDQEATVLDLKKNSLGGRLFYALMVKIGMKKAKSSDNLSKKLLMESLNSYTIHQLTTVLGGAVSYKFSEGLVLIGKGRFFKGLMVIYKDFKKAKR